MDIPHHPLTGCGQIPLYSLICQLLHYWPFLASSHPLLPCWPLSSDEPYGHHPTEHPGWTNLGQKCAFASLTDYWPPCWTLFSQQLVLDIIPKKSSTVFQIYFLWLPSDSVCLMSDRFPPSHLCRPLSPTSLIENQSIAVTKIVYLPVFLIMSSCLSNYLSRYA